MIPAAERSILIAIAATGADTNGIFCSISVPAAEHPRSKARRGMPVPETGVEKRAAFVGVVRCLSGCCRWRIEMGCLVLGTVIRLEERMYNTEHVMVHL
jgi:hypothetical protein